MTLTPYSNPPPDDLADTEPFVRLRRAIEELGVFQKHAVLRKALAPIIETQLAEFAKAEFQGEIRARVIAINEQIDRLKWVSRNRLLTEILPQFIRTAEAIVETIQASSLIATAAGRRFAMLIATAFLAELISALPSTMADGNQHLVRDVGQAVEAMMAVE